MTSELKVDKITPASGTNTQIGEAGDTTNLSAGTVTLPTSIITGQTEKTTLVDADKFLISDSAASGAFKYVQKSNLPSGGLVHLNTSTITSNTSAMTIDGVFTSTYNNYMIIGDMTSNGNSNPQFHFRSTAPATITNSNYKYGFAGCKENGNAVTNSQNANSVFEFATQLYNSNQIDPPSCWFQFFINSPNNSVHNTTFTGNYGVWKENGNIEAYAGAGFLTLQTACGGIRFSMSANDINNATVNVYGMVDS